MYTLSGKNEAGEWVSIDNTIYDEFAESHTAEYLGQYYPDYKEFKLEKNDEPDKYLRQYNLEKNEESVDDGKQQ